MPYPVLKNKLFYQQLFLITNLYCFACGSTLLASEQSYQPNLDQQQQIEQGEEEFQQGKNFYEAAEQEEVELDKKQILYQKAVYFYFLAADKGNPKAQCNLGIMYSKGQGVEQSDEEVAKWFSLAAKQGHAKSQHNLGIMYCNGRGVARSYEEAVKWYNEAANQGHAGAQYNLGSMYYNGQGVDKHEATALKYFQLAAQQGHAPAQTNLGCMYATSQGVRQSYEEALKWYNLAAQQEHAPAQFNLGLMYYHGQGVRQSYEEALKWYNLAAQQEHASAQFNLGLMYYHGQGVEKDEAAALKYFQLAAVQGDALAQTNLGLMYKKGQGVEEDEAVAVKYLQLAADQGHASAQFNLGVMYAIGQGIEKDETAAVRYFQLAANQGDASAQVSLGLMYANGKGIEKDETTSARYFQLAANQGDASAQFNLGLMYANGKGVEKDETTSARYFQLAADQGDASAQVNLGLMYENGKGVEKDEATAVRYYYLAADQGDSVAQFNLGLMYENGEGVKKDETTAIRYYRLAANQGNADAQVNLGLMYEDGRGLEEDEVAAMRYYRLAASQGNVDAQVNLGLMYKESRGVRLSNNNKEAYRWLKKGYKGFKADPYASIVSYNNSVTNLALLYLTGRSTLKNIKKAFKLLKNANPQTLNHKDNISWVEKVVYFYKKSLHPQEIKEELSLINFLCKFNEEMRRKGNFDFLLKLDDSSLSLKDTFLKYKELSLAKKIPSQIKLGIMLEYGVGCSQDAFKAREWYNEAVQRGSKKALSLISDLHEEYSDARDYHAQALSWYFRGVHNLNAYSLERLSFVYTNKEEKQQSWFCQKHFLACNHGKLLVEQIKGSLSDEILDELIREGIPSITEGERLKKQGNFTNHSKVFEIYVEEAFKVNHYALYMLGIACNQGWHLLCYPDLLKWYEDLAKQGDAEAQYSLGNIYAQDINVEADELKSFNFYGDAASQGHAEAQYMLGFLLSKRQMTFLALEWYEKAATQGYPKALCTLGEFYEKGRNVNQDYSKAIKYYKQGALYGDDENRDHLVRVARSKNFPIQSEAQAALGHLYADIRIVRPEDTSDEEVFSWLEQASQRGDIEAHYRLARMYQYGWGIDKDEAKAFSFFKQAAEDHWHDKSQKAIAEMYYLGMGIEPSEEEAFRWYRRAAKQDDQGATGAIREMAYGCFDRAIYSVGKACADGWGIARDKREAKKWYRKAIKVHYSPAKYALAEMLLKEIDKDKKEAKAKPTTSKQSRLFKKNSFDGIHRKLTQAIDLLTEASGREDRKAYLVIRYGKYDPSELEDISEQGYYKAQQKLADLYYQGLILPLNNYKNVLKAYTIAFHLHEKAFTSGGKHVDLGAFQRAQDKLNKLSNWEQDVAVGDQDEAFQKFIKVYGGIERFSPDFLCQVSYLLAQSKEFDNQVSTKVSNILQILTSLPQKSHQFTYFMTKLEEIVRSYKVSELDDLFKDIDSSDCDLGWHWIHKPSQIPANFKITQKALRDLSIEVFNSQFRELSLEAPDQSVFERAVHSIMQMFDHLQRKGLIKKEGLFDDEDQGYGDRNTLEKLLRYNPNVRFRNRIIKISDILNKEIKKDEVHTATQLMSWAIGGRHCSTRSEEETYLYYRSHILEAALEDSSLGQKKEKPLEFKIALCLAELREKLVEGIVPQGESERIHKALYLKKTARKSLGLLGDSEVFKDNLQWAVGDYQGLTEQDILSRVLTKYTPDCIADYLAEGINNARKGSVTFNQIRDRLRFQFLRDQIGSKGEFDKTLFEDEEFVLSPICNREYVEKCVLLNQIGLDKKKNPELEQKVMNWEALKGKSYEVANNLLQQEFYEDEYMTKFSRQGANALLYGLEYLER